MLANIVNMTNIYKNITNALSTNNYPAIALEMGKITKLLLDFNPIEAATNNQNFMLN